MRALVLGVATTIVVAACPAVASATDYCVDPVVNCSGTPAPSFDTALELAAKQTDADRIFLGAKEYKAQTGTGFTYTVPGSSIEIIGEGKGRTTITSPPGASSVLNLIGATAPISDLTIRIPPNVTQGATGLSTQSSARRIDVVEDGTQANSHRGVVLSGDAPLEDSSVTLGGAQQNTAVVFGAGGGIVRGSALTAWEGVASTHGGLIERSRIAGVERGVFATDNFTTVVGTLVRFSKAGGGGIASLNGAGSSITSVKADSVTIIGPGYAGTIGAGAASGGALPNATAELILTNSIIRGAASSLWVSDAGRTGSAKVRASYSDYDPSGNVVASIGALTESNVSNVGDAGFVDPAAGDYHLRDTSPLLDRGDPGTLLQGLDLDGSPLVTDGNGDGVAVRDMGAFEHPAAPLGTPAGADSTAPRITGFRAAPSVFAVPRGTRLRYTLSEAAGVTIKIQRNLPGRRSSGRCLRPSPRLRHAKRCVRHPTVGTLKRSALNGANRMRFTGKVAKRALRRGSYRAVIRATDAAGNVSAPARLRFRIVRASSRG